MLLASAAHPNLINSVLLAILIIGLASVMKVFKQPYVVAYIIAGILLGPNFFGIIENEESIHLFGEFGLILLLFFIGMEISLPDLLKFWKISVFGTIAQILASILMVAAIGFFFHWEWNVIIVMGFVISLSSSAVVIKLLQDTDESESEVGQSVISVLLMQDILIVPMLIATGYLSGEVPSTREIVMQIIGGIFLIGGIIWVTTKHKFVLPFSKNFEKDHELQVFVAFLICFGFAVISAWFGLSAALGAFVAGMVVHASKSTEWFHDSLHSFRVVFVALFFVSIGLLIDINFLKENWQLVALIMIAVYIGNHFINAFIIHYFGRNWSNSLYAGALLAQIGELSFVIASTAFYSKIISTFEYQLTVIVISMTLLFSPIYIAITKRLVHYRKQILDHVRTTENM